MKVRSIKANYLLNTLRIASSTLIGVFTMPYINNVLGPGNLGKVEYVNSIITYFILFSSLGIPVYGIRQIAKVRDNANELSKTVLEILGILLFTSLLAYIILFVILYGTNIFIDYKSLIIIMSSMIILNNLGAEWFFQGIEDQLYITIRYFIVRIITVILLFLFVKTTEDYMYYAVIVILNFCGSNFLNLFRLKKYINTADINFKSLNFIKHVKPSLTIFIASISISIYLQIDTFLLGYLAGDKYVGLYSVANKLLRYVITFIVSAGAVLLPRLSNLWHTDRNMYESYLIKAFHFLLLISIPFSIYFYFFAKDIIGLMAGSQFTDAILTLKILAPVCFLVAMAYFFGYLLLYTQGKEKLYTISVSVSAMLSIFLNYFLITKYQQNGAALTQLFSEFVGISIVLLFFQDKSLYKKLMTLKSLKIVLINLILIVFGIIYFNQINFTSIISFNQVYTTLIINFMVNSILFGVVYFILLLLIKEETTNKILKSLINKYKK